MDEQSTLNLRSLRQLMELNVYFKSIIDQDTAPIVICDAGHTIIYMNPCRGRALQKKRGGENLVGRGILDCHNENSQKMIIDITEGFKANSIEDVFFTYHNKKDNRDVFMVALRDENGKFIGYYEKHEYKKICTVKQY